MPNLITDLKTLFKFFTLWFLNLLFIFAFQKILECSILDVLHNDIEIVLIDESVVNLGQEFTVLIIDQNIALPNDTFNLLRSE